MSAWLVAARPATLLAAVTPVLVGSALAHAGGAFRWDAAVVALAGALLIQTGVNFANDAADAARGVDTAHRLGPPRAVATGLLTSRQVWRGVAVVFTLAAVAGVYLAAISDWPILVVGAVSLVAALGYTSGPAYGYRALGDLFVFLFFGPVATVGTRYVHDATAPADAWIMSVPVGLLITAILVVNNVRDIDTDAAAGKRTLAVVIGRRYSAWLYLGLLAGAFGVTAVAAAVSWVPPLAATGLLALPLAVEPTGVVFSRREATELIRALKATARLQFAFGAMAAAGIAVGAAL